jgi:hypothetical protein
MTLNPTNGQFVIDLENSAPDGNDTWYDWMLHYLCCTQMPLDAVPPGNPPVNPPAGTSDGSGDGLTAGCSNSQYP